jgi:alginate O-acetyltransferase complex protein AlgI
MLFNTIDFMVFFIVVLAIISAVKYRKFQHVFLLIASYFFFYYSSNYLIILLIASTILDFYIGKMIWKTKNVTRKKLLLIISLAGNLGLLGFFKYADFAILQFNVLGEQFNLASNIPLLNLALPIGISFYTFQTISYTIDIYRGKLKPSESLKEFALFVAFFPQLVAGPIVRASEFLPQLREKIEVGGGNLKLIIIHNSNLKLGITIMAFGFLKKMFFADNIAPIVNNIFSNPIGMDSFTIILGTIAFGIQVYGDFSGYSDIAIGAALIIGFKIPANFNKPFFASSPSDFWRRWHISLSSWVKDYLFLPLVYRKIGSDTVLISGTIVTFLVLGLWHGAGWNFIFFGLIHGIYVATEVFIRRKHPSFANNRFFKTTQGRVISILFTQYLVFFAWISFRVENIDFMFYSMQKFIIWDFQTTTIKQVIDSNEVAVILIGVFGILNLILYKQRNIHVKISQMQLWKWFFFILIITLLIFLTFAGHTDDFIYFQF